MQLLQRMEEGRGSQKKREEEREGMAAFGRHGAKMEIPSEKKVE